MEKPSVAGSLASTRNTLHQHALQLVEDVWSTRKRTSTTLRLGRKIVYKVIIN